MNNEDKEKDSDTFKCIAALIGVLIGFVSAGFLTKKAIDKYYEPEQRK